MPNLSCLSPCRRALKATRVLAAACLLVQGGMTADAAIALVRQNRSPHAIETREQEQFVHDFADVVPV